ncbi:succinate dehydrogenase, cytochrome b556 subunit [Legionella sp. W05-934-2]|uniref:succinate dehydrogenase, cytochrome b556 subunit n=1 Tax=Legionella sp. W05-934-2 TaxID=1198649 RepID=UPI0034618486
MNKKRPVNLDLATMRFPVMAIASIFHRLSGIGIFVLLPFMMWYLHASLQSEKSFIATKSLLGSPIHLIIIWAFLVSLGYHILAGLRHIFMDLGWGEDLSSGRKSAATVIVIAIILAILAGIWIW